MATTSLYSAFVQTRKKTFLWTDEIQCIRLFFIYSLCFHVSHLRNLCHNQGHVFLVSYMFYGFNSHV